MSRIKSKNTNLEASFYRLISKELYPKGFRYRKHYRALAGRPDLVFVGRKIAVFIDGDFWHGYGFGKIKNRLPKKYWRQKIENNINRDKRTTKALKRKGWTVVRIWEHEIEKNPSAAKNRILRILGGKRQSTQK